MEKQDWIKAHFSNSVRERAAAKMVNVGDEIEYLRSEDGGGRFTEPAPSSCGSGIRSRAR